MLGSQPIEPHVGHSPLGFSCFLRLYSSKSEGVNRPWTILANSVSVMRSRKNLAIS